MMKTFCKYFIVIWVFNFTTVSTVSAQIAERYLQTDTFTVSETACEMQGYIYLNRAFGSFYNWALEEQYVMRLNSSLKTVDSLFLNPLFNIPNGNYLYCTMIENTGVNELTVLLNEEYVKPNGSSGQFYYSKMHVLQLDSTLSVLNKFTIKADSVGYVRLLDVNQYMDTLYLSGFIWDSTRQNGGGVVVKTTKTGNWIKTWFYPDPQGRLFMRDISFQVSCNLVSTPGAFYAPTYAIVNKGFDLIARPPGNAPAAYPGRTYSFYESGFFVEPPGELPLFLGSCSFQIDTSLSFLMGVGHLDSNYHITQIDSFQFSGINTGDYTGPAPGLDGFDYRSPDSVLMVMAGQEYYFGGRKASDMYIYNYNAVTKQMNWIKVYNSGYNQINNTSVEVLPGNNYLLVLNEENWDKHSYPNMQIHLMLLNNKGDILGEEEVPCFHNAVGVYPNPFDEDFTVSGVPMEAGKYLYSICTPAGKVVASGELSPSGVVSMKRMAKGQFFLIIYNDKGFSQCVPIRKR